MNNVYVLKIFIYSPVTKSSCNFETDGNWYTGNKKGIRKFDWSSVGGPDLGLGALSGKYLYSHLRVLVHCQPKLWFALNSYFMWCTKTKCRHYTGVWCVGQGIQTQVSLIKITEINQFHFLIYIKIQSKYYSFLIKGFWAGSLNFVV